MLIRCSCGSSRFRPVGIQTGWPGRRGGNAPRLLYLVNCESCGTTKVCDRLQYALLKSREASNLMELGFFTGESKAA